MPSPPNPVLDMPTQKAAVRANAQTHGEERSGMGGDQAGDQCEGGRPVCLRNQRAK
jgi:hypothetical protein